MSENDMHGPRRIVALVRDLMFASRVRGVASEAAVVRTVEQLEAAVGSATRLVVVELEASGSLEGIERVRARAPEARIVAFAPHVLEERLESARVAGAEVLSRGAFVRNLPELVAAARA